MAMAWIFSASLQGPNSKRLIAEWIQARAAFTLLFVCFSTLAASQKLIWSEAARNDRALERVKAVSESDSVFHVIEEREDHILRWIQCEKDSLRILNAREIVPASKENTLEHFFIFNDTLYTLSTRRNRDSDQLEVLAMCYDSRGNALCSEQLVHQLSEPVNSKRSGLQCKISPDGTCILLYFDKDSERKQTEGIHFKCYNRYWNLNWEKDLRLPPSPDVLQVHHFLVDNYGGVYMMSGRNPVKTSSDWQRPQGGQYVVYYYNSTRNKLKQYDINLKDKQVISTGFLLNEKQEVIIAGYYSNNFQNKVSGTLLFKLEAQGGAISLAGYTPFPKEFQKEASGRETGSLEDFYLDHIHLTENGSVILVGEQYYVSRSVSTDPTTGRQIVEYRYNYDDLIACMLDTAAQQLWNILIPKRQMSSTLNDANFSYAFSANAAGIALTFNDDRANNEVASNNKRSQTALWSGGKNSVTTQVEIDFKGNFVRRTLIDNSAERLLFNPLMTATAPWTKTLLGFDDKRTYKFCVLR
jgi:hypothetical protein